MEFIKAKTILTKVKYGSDWYGIDYNMNLYKGCSHGCIYCDSRSNCYPIDKIKTISYMEYCNKVNLVNCKTWDF